jgi:hydroxymethylpyrimidine pyrophosphatase-like HAD family hydrolase
MKLSVLALDYDGTIARNDRLDPDVLDAIGQAQLSMVPTDRQRGRSSFPE